VDSIEEIKPLMRKHALLNAVKHDGSANKAAVIGKVLAERPELKAFVKDIEKTVASLVDEINLLTLSDQRKIVEENWPELLLEAKAREEKALPPLANVDKYPQIITRYAPNPDCVLHLGNVRAIVLSHDYARMYRGRFYLRFEDTDPRLKKPVLDFYDSIREDLVWLGCKWDKEFIQSDRLPIYYEYVEKLLGVGGAYVCTCSKEAFSKLLLSKQPCPCRNLTLPEQLDRWGKMLSGFYRQGEAIVRVKTDLTHPNPAVRDWPALRIIDSEKYPHPRVSRKYHLWPLYNLACGLDDHLMGITHIIRGKEHITNEVRQRYMYKHLGWEFPETIHYGRLKVVGADLSKSKIMRAFDEGVVKNFGDPRLATLMAIRKRGLSPDGLRKIVSEVGTKPADITLSWENIYALNRKIVDAIANRYFFVQNPILLQVSGLQKVFTSTPLLHPDYPERGCRQLEVKPTEGLAKLRISQSDMNLFEKGKVVRLMELFNVKIEDVKPNRIKAEFQSETYLDAKKLNAPLIHWLPEKENIRVSVVMPKAELAEGLGETGFANENVNNIIQMERFGFGRVDEKNNQHILVYYAHK